MLRLRTFGGLSLESDSALGAAALQRRRLAILTLLAASRDRGMSRDKLLAYLWPASNTERARHTLSQLLYALRRDLDADAVVADAGDILRLNRDAIWSDVAEFEDALDRHEAERGLALYRGAFLDGWFIAEAPEFERWVEHERGRLAQRAMLALRGLADAATARADHDAATRWWRQLVTMDPLATRPTLGLMTALAASGDRAAALRHAHVYESLMRQELDAGPDASVVLLIEQLRGGTTAVEAPEPSSQAPLPPVVSAAQSQPDLPNVAEPIAHGSRTRAVAILAAVVILSMLVATTNALLPRQRELRGNVELSGTRQREAVADRRSVAVLPFLNMSSDRENEYFSDGMTEELINALARAGGLRVPARTSAFAFKGKLVGASEIARQLNVASVVEGSVRRSGKQVRITARLIDARTGYELWSEVYDRELNDVIQVQENIARAITAKLRGDLLTETRPRVARVLRRNPDAYDLFLRGRYFWNQRTSESLERSIAYYRRALAIDSTDAPSYAGLADSYAILGANGFRPLPDVLPQAEAAAARALALDSTLSEVHATRALIRWLEWKWAAAGAEFRRAVSEDSAYTPARVWYALYLSGLGRFDEAIPEILRARALDPLSLIANTEVGRVFELAHRDREAEHAYGAALEIDSTFQPANYLLAMLHLRTGQLGAGARDVSRLLQRNTESQIAALRAYGYARQGDTALAARVLGELTSTSRQRYVSPYSIACVYAALGDRTKAFRWLDRAFVGHASEMYALEVDPLLVSLHGDARWQRIVAAVHPD